MRGENVEYHEKVEKVSLGQTSAENGAAKTHEPVSCSVSGVSLHRVCSSSTGSRVYLRFRESFFLSTCNHVTLSLDDPTVLYGAGLSLRPERL